MSNVYLWLNHNIQVVDLDDSRFQGIEDHVEGDDKSHRERLHMQRVIQQPGGMEQLKGSSKGSMWATPGRREDAA